MLLDQLPTGQPAQIDAIDWSMMPEHEGQRLRALGFDVGATVRIRHRGVLFGRDPIAVEIGRMTVAIRRLHARAMSLSIAPQNLSSPSDPLADITLPQTGAAG